MAPLAPVVVDEEGVPLLLLAVVHALACVAQGQAPAWGLVVLACS